MMSSLRVTWGLYLRYLQDCSAYGSKCPGEVGDRMGLAVIVLFVLLVYVIERG